MTLTLTPKFVRAHTVNAQIPGTKSLPWFFKLIYEFWGFCMHGSADQGTPGGFPSNGVNFPSGFQTGSLLLTGSDGYTHVGEQFFRSDTINFTSGGNAIVGKHIVAWVPGSTSTDDSIYEVVQVVNSGTIRVNTFTGATPYTGSLVPFFSERTGIKFRIIDFAAMVTATTFTSGQYLVMPLSGVSLVNAGQAIPYFKLALGGTTDTFVMSWSPSGSYDPVSGFFTDETPAYSKAWRNSTSVGNGNFTLWAADDFMIGHYDPFGTAGWDSSGLPSNFHIEIPQRLYPQGVDPNPVVGMNSGRLSLVTTNTTENYGGGWFMQTPQLPTSSYGRWTTLARSPVSDYFVGQTNSVFGSGNAYGTFVTGRHNNVVYNPYSSKFYVSDVLLCQPGIINQFSLARVRLRRFRVTALIPPRYARLGASGEWIHLYNGIVLPWDNGVIPNVFPSGG